ncbi:MULTISPECIES: ferritin family protein [unclassified Fusibacter]|uniref:ferritin-like domain-containing protein n=1 Tax=unclassified Fusibacter TaxID=2624464 RepID=UPI00101209BD|nr:MULTISPECIES: ferritin family protein [unclassified Fusibacter]MCK8059810.1 ferritin family protein [Fusibacter sp. A2]NPE21611.1 ferritin family protein [Fusibacter sp. A1]RXV62018.1 hypothetical protein DWB64_07195 [Fusibacter sp. A1]
MDIYQMAMNMELEGKAFYLDLKEKATDRSIQTIFGLLAEEEQKHHDLIRAMKQNTAQLPTSEKLDLAEGFFNELIVNALSFTTQTSVIDAYKEAKHLEENSIAFYKQEILKAKKAIDKAVLLKIYYEEKKHKLLLENLIEFLSESEIQIDSAEFDRLESKDYL